MPLRDHLSLLARYHAWATRRLLDEHIAALPEADYRHDCGLFFKSIHGTLNHLLVAEGMLWFGRFAAGVSPSGLGLNDEVETDRERLAQRLHAAAQAWGPYIDGLDAARLDTLFSYRTSKGIPATTPFGATLAHVFNHATHHRGQITAGLTVMGHPCPELDLIYMLREEQGSAA